MRNHLIDYNVFNIYIMFQSLKQGDTDHQTVVETEHLQQHVWDTILLDGLQTID